MEEVFSNLIGNAIKFLEPTREGAIKITGSRSTDETLFSVTDNGRGIATCDLSRIFQVFQPAGHRTCPVKEWDWLTSGP